MTYKSLKFIILFSFLLSFVVFAKPVTVKVEVIDEEGNPVEGALVAMSFLLVRGSNYEEESTGSDGRIDVTNNADFGVSMTAMKDGYYNSSLRTGYGDQDITLLLRKKKNPIAMYAKKIHIQPPVFDEEFGYDFVEGDYVAPHGGGKISDLIMKVRYQKTDFFNKEYYLSIRFNNPRDGLSPFFVEHKKSKYESAYLAPPSNYQNEWDFQSISVKGKPDDTNLDKQRNYYFRVRTVLDEDGTIESAHYGKIYGEFPRITYYFNPVPNDRNVEFDVKQNLFKDLESPERPRDP